MPINCFVFLGNPGREYEKTRHNAGWLVADQIGLSIKQSLVWTEKFDGRVAISEINQQKCFWFKPQCFMNLTGGAVRKLVDFYKLEIENILVVHDDLELSFGQFAFKTNGGAGGHNGLRSLDVNLGSSDYQRCRIGIGRPRHGDVASYVLSRFSSEEAISLPLILERVADAILGIAGGAKPATTKIQVIQEFKSARKA